MSMYIFQFISDSPYVDMDPRPDAEVSKLIANGTIPTINKYFNSLCARNKIISFKGMVPEWCIIETLVFLGLNFSMVLTMIRRHFFVVTRDYSLDFTIN